MTSLPAPDQNTISLEQLERLIGLAVSTLSPIGRGANNQLFRVETAAAPVAVKRYFHHAEDGRDRLGAEVAALRFLSGGGITCVPHLIAADVEAGLVVTSWIDGIPVGARLAGDVAQLMEFLGQLQRAANKPEAAALPLASEACLSAAELTSQLERRLGRLTEGAQDIDGLLADLRRAITTTTDRTQDAYRQRGWDFAAELPRDLRILSPSDFGTHNALRRPDGTLAFLDFEYFGWDDPVKLIADTLLHPGMALDECERREFGAAALDLFNIRDRLAILLPLYALRWALIVLNPFLPERWARLSFATGAERDGVLADRVAKARRFLALTEEGAFLL